MFGFGKKKDADSGSLYVALIQMTSAHLEKFGVMPSEDKVLSDVEKLLAHYGARLRPEHVPPLRLAAFMISNGVGDLDEVFKKIGGHANLTDERMEIIALELRRRGVSFS